MKIMMVFTIILTLFIIGCTSVVDDYDYIWKAEDSPVIIDSCFTVSAGEILKIEPGVVVQFRASTFTDIYEVQEFDFDFENLAVGMLIIRGKLLAVGTEVDSIIFTRAGDSGKWGIILLKDSANSKIKNCIFEHSNYLVNFEDNNYVGTLSLHNSSADISENTFRDNEYDGIEAWSSDETEIHHNIFTENRRGVYCKECSCNIKDNSFYHNPKGIHCYDHSSPDIISNLFESTGNAIVCFDYSSPFISGCTIKSCQDGIYMEHSSPIIIGNLIMDNSADGIDCVTDDCMPEIINNTIVNNDYYGLARSMHTYPTIVNNIFWGNGRSSVRFFENYQNPVISYCLLQENEIPLESDGGNNIFNQNPQFVDSDTGNYQLLADSPCIDSGLISDSLLIEALDILDNARISGNSIDIGCIEYQN